MVPISPASVRVRVWIVIAAIAAVLATIAIVWFSQDHPTVGSGDVGPNQRSVIESADGRMTVIIDPGTVAGNGILSISPVADADDRRGWTVKLDGTELTGEAELRFHGTRLDKGEPLPLVSWAEPGSDAAGIASKMKLDGEDLIVTTDHFSNWFVDRWNDIRDWVQKKIVSAIKAAASISPDRAPDCTGQDQAKDAGYSATSDSGSRVYWCLGMDDQRVVLKAVNARWYGAVAEYTPGLEVSHADQGGLLSPFVDMLTPPPPLKKNKTKVVESGNEIDFAVDSRTTLSGAAFSPDPGAYLISALQYAVDTATMVYEKVGVKDATQKLIVALKGSACLGSFVDLAQTDLATPQQTRQFFSHALSMALDCASIAGKSIDLGWILQGVVSGVVWVLSGLKLVTDGIVAAADLVFDSNGYQIRVTHTMPALTPQSASELLIPADTCTGWPQPKPIRLHQGSGESFNADREGAGILESRLIGTPDLNGDGVDDAVLTLRCTGTPKALCCAGRLSTELEVVALDVSSDTPRLIAPAITGESVNIAGTDEPRTIVDDRVKLDGEVIETYQVPVYGDNYTEGQIAEATGFVRYELNAGSWTRIGG